MAVSSSSSTIACQSDGQPPVCETGHAQHHHSLRQIISDADEKDARDRYREETADNIVGARSHEQRYQPHPWQTPSLSPSENETSIVAWNENDPENPYNWSKTRKIAILITTMINIINSTMGSALPSNDVQAMTKEWHVTSTTQMVLPVSIYLVGYIVGPLVWAPLSEQYGRKMLVLVGFMIFMVWTMACALAPSWSAFLVFRLLTGIFASAPMAVVSGILADIFGSTVTRGRAMAMFMAMTVLGPLFAPIVSGYCSSTIGWRWSFWIALIYAAVSLIPLALMPETHGPVLLQLRAVRMRKQDPTANVVAPHEQEKKGLHELLAIVLTRPLRMIASEPVVSCVSVYLSLVYAIFYMTFTAFPLVFEDIYRFSPGVEGLIFLAIGAGTFLAIPIFYAYDSYLHAAMDRGEEWTKQEEYRRLPLACLGGPVFSISMFWLGWTARSDVSFAAPMLAGVPFGLGFMLIFIALLNYLTDAYEIFAASANAAASCCRSLLATVLPLAATPMFKRLTIPGACSLLGGLSLLMCVIPFLFIWKGERIRAGSKFCIALHQRKLEMQQKVEIQRQRALQQQQNRTDKPPQ